MVEVQVKQIETIESGITEEVLTKLAIKKRGEATELLVENIEQQKNIYTTRSDIKSEMWIYKEGIYIPQGKSFIKEYCRKMLGQAFNTHICNEVINKIEADTFIESESFFENKYIYEIPVQNGILNINSRELSHFTPEKIFFNKLPIKYNPDLDCEKIDKFLSDVLKNEEDKTVFYEIAGFGLLKDYRFEKAFMFVGDGRNGKGKALELLKRLVGAENCSGIPLGSLRSDSFNISELFGKLFNLAGDISSKDLKETGMFKSLTGRDTISAQRKFLKDLIFQNYSKMIFACNELPRVYDYSSGFWERWILFEFPYKFVDKDIFEKEEDKTNLKIKDINIIDKITTEKELSGFLNAALDGLERIMKKEKFSSSKGTKETKDTWIRKSDSFMAFCMDCIVEDYKEKISKKELRKNYSLYCKNHKVSGVSDISIKITLQEMFGVIDEYISSGFENQEWCWTGIKFKDKNIL